MKTILILLSIIHFAEFDTLSLYGRMTITPLTILEKTRKATYIVRVKLIEIGDETFKVYTEYGQWNVPVITKQYGYYKILEIVKGDMEGDRLTIDYKKIYDAYKPQTELSILQPEENEETILFLYKGLNFVKGYQGKIRSDRIDLEKYMEAVKLCLSYDLLTPSDKFERAREYIKINSMLKNSMNSELHTFESIEQNAKLLKSDDYLLQKSAINSLMYIDSKNPGLVQDSLIFDDILAVAKDSTFSNKSKIAIIALGVFKLKKAIPFLEESLNNENDVIRDAAARALEKIKE